MNVCFTEPDDNEVSISSGRPAYQSTTYGSAVAGRAVDGDPDTGSCTYYSVNPWWAVDLGEPVDVGSVTVTNDGNPYYRKCASQ